VQQPPIATGGRTVNAGVAELAAIPRWVCWKAVERDGKPTKVPYTPAGSKAKSTDPRTWSTFDECFAAAFVDGRHDGIGFVFTADDDLAGVDLDGCVEDGRVEPWAAEIVSGMASYAEISPSGTGVKLWIRGTLPEPGRRNGRLEVYGAKRFFTITGQHLAGTPERINGAQAAVDALWAKHFSKSRARTNGSANGGPDDLPPYPDQAAVETLLRDPTAAAYWHQGFTVTPADDRSPSGWDLAFAGWLARKGLGRLEAAAMLRAYRAHHAPAKGKQDRADYVFATVDQAIGEVPAGRASDDDETFDQRDGEQASGAEQPRGRSGAAVKPQGTDWMWHPYFPAGELALLGARGGVGKGQAAASVVARLTRGFLWPDGSTIEAAGHVLWAESEDSIAKTVVPRLMANNADLGRVTFFTEGEFSALDVRRFVEEHNIRMILLSPIMSFLPRLRSHIDELAVRAALRQLHDAVQHTSCALVGIAHLNKKADLDAIERLLGSVAFVNFVRSVVLVATNKERPEVRRWMHAKYNLSVKGSDLLFRTVHAGEDPRDQFVRTDWEIAGENADVDSCFQSRQYGNGKPKAGEWLIAYLEEHGRSLAADVMTAGEAAGYSQDTIRKAQYREQRIDFYKEGFPAQVYWFCTGQQS
jgi:AAA domain